MYQYLFKFRIEKKKGNIDVVRAKLSAAREGVMLALELGVRLVILEGDSRVAFESIETSSWNLSYNGTLVHDICSMGLRFDRFKAQFVPRTRHRVANALARYAKICWDKGLVKGLS